MKNTLLLLLVSLLLLTKARAQITLDQSYATPSSGRAELFMVNLEVSGPKYVLKRQDSGFRFLQFYNLNHSLWKTINCNPFRTSIIPPTGQTQFNFGSFYISEHLFDCDSNIEFLYTSYAGNPASGFVGVYNEQGSQVFGADSAFSYMNVGATQGNYQNRTIYNTPSGTKMIIQKNRYVSGAWRSDPMVYNLPCTLSTSIGGLNKEGQEGDLTVVPNPHFYESTIKYTLPDGLNQAEIIITNMDGRELKRYTVDRTFNSLLIAHDDLPSGTYLYTLIGEGTVLSSKKVIKLN